jgi:hypothetical protein
VVKWAKARWQTLDPEELTQKIEDHTRRSDLDETTVRKLLDRLDK